MLKYTLKVLLFVVLFCSFQGYSFGAELFFSSGFESGCIGAPTEAHTDITGDDGSPSGDWEDNLDDHYNIGSHNIGYEPGDKSDRYAKIIDDPTESGNKILHYRINEATEPMAGGGYKGRIQSNISVINNLTEITYKIRLYIHTDFNELKSMNDGFTWMSLGEFWNNLPGNDDIFRVTLCVSKAAGTVDGFQFRVTAETYNIVDGFELVWEEDSKLNVPIGEWIDLEVYYKEGDDTEGRFSVSQTDSDGIYNVIFDITDWTYDPAATTLDGLNFFSPMKLYCADTLINHIRDKGGALQIYWDDFELWKGDARTGIHEAIYSGSRQRTEAETDYSEVVDAVSNNIYVYSSYDQASNGAAVSLIDSGDSISIPFTVTQSGSYKLNLRVRSGTASDDCYYFNNDGYAIKVDGETVSFTGDEESTVLETIPSSAYWGTLVSPVLQLASGSHTVEVTADQNWVRVDYLDLLQEQVVEAETNYSEVADAVSNNIYVYSSYDQASNGAAVSLIDSGDSISIPFTVTKSGSHKLNLRVRSGTLTNALSYFNGGYVIKVDGETVLFTGDEPNTVLETIPSSAYWGTLVSPVLQLEAGSHAVEVTMVQTWGRVDYLEVLQKQVVEAETNYTEEVDVDPNNIYVYSSYALASNNAAVSLIDIGDSISIPFTVTQSGSHKLNLRIRSGTSTNDRCYFSEYAIKVDGETVLFTEDLESIVSETIPSSAYWGTLVSPVLQLEAGSHAVEVTALHSWMRVDYLEVLPPTGW